MKRPYVSVYIGISQDGFIARPNGDIDWLTDERYSIAGEDYGYQAFFNSIDTMVIGRMTFEKVLTFGQWPYEGKRILVLSSTNLALPDELKNQVSFLSLSPGEVLQVVAEQGGKHVYLDGGQTIQRFLYGGVVDSLILTRLPVLIGQGIPLFGPLQSDIHLQHVETRTYTNGTVQSRYLLQSA